MAQEDSYTISYIKREIERAWKLIEAAEDKEEKARKLFEDLKSENEHLHKIVEQGSGLAISDEKTVHKLMES